MDLFAMIISSAILIFLLMFINPMFGGFVLGSIVLGSIFRIITLLKEIKAKLEKTDEK